MTSTILFLCPHAAAKSVIAAAYFNRLAKEKSLDWFADAAGTEPDKLVSPAVVKLLAAESLDVSQHQPRRISPAELKIATRVISLGCNLEDLAISEDKVEQWLDIPAPSQDLLGARDTILRHIELLVENL